MQSLQKFMGFNPIVVLAGLISVAIGLVDLWHFGSLSHDSDLLFIVGGLAALGVHFVNGSAGSILSAVADLKSHVADVNAIAAADGEKRG